jgi:hypothetical protein
MGGSALHRHRHHWTTRRDEKRAAGGREWVLKPRRPSRGGSRPAPAERGRDRYWHWQAASCWAALVLEFLEACVLGECVRGVGAVGRSIAATFRVPTVGRSPAPASAPLASFTNFHGTSTHLYFLSNTAGRSWFSWTRVTRAGVLPADLEVRCKGDRRSCCQCGSASLWPQFASRSAAVNVK